MDVTDSSSTVDLLPGPRRFATSLRDLAVHQGIDETLQLMVDLSTELIVGCDLADVMLVSATGTTTPVATEPLAVEVDRAQIEAGEGPCLHAALDHDPVVRANDLESDGRWPTFGPKAVTLGIRSVMSFRLSQAGDHPRRIGALNLYSRQPHAFQTSAAELGEVLAAQCAAVLVAAIELDGLRTALATRDTIGQAKGILMERHNVDAAAAFELLRRASQDRNIKLNEVARAVVDQRPAR